VAATIPDIGLIQYTLNFYQNKTIVAMEAVTNAAKGEVVNKAIELARSLLKNSSSPPSGSGVGVRVVFGVVVIRTGVVVRGGVVFGVVVVRTGVVVDVLSAGESQFTHMLYILS
jgi:hypothetical protein